MPNLDVSSNFTRGEIFKLDNHIEYSIVNTSPFNFPDDFFLEIGYIDKFEFYRLSEFETENVLSIVMMQVVIFNGARFKECFLAESLYIRKGYCSILYKYIIRTSTIPILSHSRNTHPGSMDLWKYLRFNWKKKNVTIGYFDTKTFRLHKWLRTTKQYRIWGIVDGYFQVEDNISPLEVLEDMMEYESINYHLYDFIKNNFAKIHDRGHIRLYAFHE